MRGSNEPHETTRSVKKGTRLASVLKLVGLAFLLFGFASCVLAMSQYG